MKNSSLMQIKRLDHEPPIATNEWGWRYHHIGIPTQGYHSDEKPG